MTLFIAGAVVGGLVTLLCLLLKFHDDVMMLERVYTQQITDLLKRIRRLEEE